MGHVVRAGHAQNEEAGELMPTSWSEALDIIQANLCYCGGDKLPGHAFCRLDHNRLPELLKLELRGAVIGRGFEEAYDRALVVLETKAAARAAGAAGGV